MRIKKGSPIHELLKGKCLFENREGIDQDEAIDVIGGVYCDAALENVYTFSRTVFGYISENFQKFTSIAHENIYNEQGLIFYAKNHSVAYKSFTEGGKRFICCVFFYKNVAKCFEFVALENSEKLRVLHYIPPPKDTMPGYTVGHFATQIMAYLMFKKYAKVEVKTIDGADNKKAKIDGIKYMNETDFKVKIYDSHYFKTIIRSGAFKVSGHFRLQPCGPNRSERKLIWIKDFQKTGYTREAGIKKQSL